MQVPAVQAVAKLPHSAVCPEGHVLQVECCSEFFSASASTFVSVLMKKLSP